MLSPANSALQTGPGAHIHTDSTITADTVVGAFTGITGPATIRGAGRCTIGAYCAIGYHLNVVTQNHRVSGPNVQFGVHQRHGYRDLVEPRDVKIGNACWVGDRVTVLAGATIGDGAVIGAGAVVSGRIAPFAIVAGVPARLLRKRASEQVIAALLSIAWWNWSEDRISRNRSFFEADITTIDAQSLLALVQD